VTAWLTAVAAYNFFKQRGGGSTTAGDPGTVDVDQNRVFVGLQFGYPLRFE
jgi:hypothetical protein